MEVRLSRQVVIAFNSNLIAFKKAKWKMSKAYYILLRIKKKQLINSKRNRNGVCEALILREESFERSLLTSVANFEWRRKFEKAEWKKKVLWWKKIDFFLVKKITKKNFLCLIRIFWNFFMRTFKIQNQSFAIILLRDLGNLRVMSDSNFLTMFLTDEILFNINFISNTSKAKKYIIKLK